MIDGWSIKVFSINFNHEYWPILKPLKMNWWHYIRQTFFNLVTEIQKAPLSLTSTATITTLAGTGIIPVQISGPSTTTTTSSTLHVPNVSSIVRSSVPAVHHQTQFSHLPRGKIDTVKPVNKGHPWERQNMVFIDKWSYFEVTLFNLIYKKLLKYGLYLEVVFYTGFTVISDFL